MISFAIALVVIGSVGCLLWWLAQKAPAELQFPIKAGLAVLFVLTILVLLRQWLRGGPMWLMAWSVLKLING